MIIDYLVGVRGSWAFDESAVHSLSTQLMSMIEKLNRISGGREPVVLADNFL